MQMPPVTSERPTAEPVVLYNGTIHSTAEPYAEAMVIDNGQVAWLGSDETAGQLRDPRSAAQDLDRALVAPGFVGLMSLTADQLQDGTVTKILDVAAHQLGYTALRVVTELGLADIASENRASTAQSLREAFNAAEQHPVEVWPVVQLRGISADGGAPSIAPVNELLDLLEGIDADGHQAAVCFDLSEVRPNLLGVRSWCTEADRQLLLDCRSSAPGVVVDSVLTSQKHLRELKQTPPPGLPTVLVGFDSAERSDWEQLLNTGVHVLLTAPGHLATALAVGVPTSAAPAEGENPWELVSCHIRHSTDPVSARAGFNAQTRGAYRSLPEAPGSSGQLNPGSPATYTVWEVESLAVQTPNAAVSAWSTDTRARTPLLPYLDGETLPRLVSTVILGR